MATVYGRIAKISNVVGRSDYLNDEKRQEKIVLQKIEMQYSWQEHSSFEKEHQKSNVANNEALEVHIALPNELAEDKRRLEQVCDDLAYEIVGENKDYEYAVHWNHNRTNLHVHILFSERENQIDLEPKVYKKDIWHDKDTHKLAKANSENAVLVHKKGEVQRDKEGNIKYQTDIFKVKDKKFTERWWLHHKNKIVKDTLNKYGYKLDLHDGIKNNPYLSQKKLYKGASKDYLDNAKAWNTEVKRYNENVKQHIELEPIQLKNYISIKQEVLANVKEANAEEKKITPKAIELVHEMADWVMDTLRNLKVYIKRKSREYEAAKAWNGIKDKFNDMFKENKRLDNEIKSLSNQIEDLNHLDHEFTEVIDSKLSLIHDIEEQEYVSEEEREFYEYFNLNKNDVEEYSQNLFEEAQKAPIVPDKMDNGFTRSVSGTWSWRDGVICVCDSYTSFLNHGHAGIVAAAPHYYSTIEANPNKGVQVVRGDWPSRFKPRVYQAGVISTSVAQDQKAAKKAASFLEKPYSLLSTLTTTDTFYCSQLVYQAYRLGAGVSLPHGLPGIITPSDLLHAGATEVTYRYE